MPGRAKQPGFVQWGERFFAYLVKEKGGTNPELMELIYNLGDDGRQELALSIYNFLRPESWKRFGKGRQQAGQQARKGLSNAIRDLRRAAASHRKLLTLVPEIGTGTLLGAGAPFCLPDFLEMEATRWPSKARGLEKYSVKSEVVPRKTTLSCSVCKNS